MRPRWQCLVHKWFTTVPSFWPSFMHQGQKVRPHCHHRASGEWMPFRSIIFWWLGRCNNSKEMDIFWGGLYTWLVAQRSFLSPQLACTSQLSVPRRLVEVPFAKKWRGHMTPPSQSWAGGPYNKLTWPPSWPLTLWLPGRVPLGPLLPAFPLFIYGKDALWICCQCLPSPICPASGWVHLCPRNGPSILHLLVVLASLTQLGWELLVPVLHLPQPTAGW